MTRGPASGKIPFDDVVDAQGTHGKIKACHVFTIKYSLVPRVLWLFDERLYDLRGRELAIFSPIFFFVFSFLILNLNGRRAFKHAQLQPRPQGLLLVQNGGRRNPWPRVVPKSHRPEGQPSSPRTENPSRAFVGIVSSIPIWRSISLTKCLN